MNLDDLLEEASQHSADRMRRLTERSKSWPMSPYATFRRDRGLLYITEPSRAVVLGDIHGDLETLARILRLSDALLRLRRSQLLLLCLGDYVDRGPYSLEVLHLLLRLRELFPDRVFLLRGNHEPPPELLPSPHDLPFRCRRKYGAQGDEVYPSLLQLFQTLPVAATLATGIIAVHGGVPTDVTQLPAIAAAPEHLPLLEELLWNDPVEGLRGREPSHRGAGWHFGPEITERFLAANQLRLVVAGHRPCDGYRFNHERRILTLFSRVGLPYLNSSAGYLDLPLDRVGDPEPFVHLVPAEG